MYRASVQVPGSCGELVQGTLKGGNFLISCPVNLYSQVTVRLAENISGVISNIEAEKTVLAVSKTLAYLERPELGAEINIETQLPRGKGMASSTADISAASGAVMAALNAYPDPELIKRVALEIEPTDAVFLPGIHLFDHIEGLTSEYLGEPPLMDILIFAGKGKVDTLDFNSQSELSILKQEKERLVEEAVALVQSGIERRNPELVGQGATQSSLAHQSILYKPGLERLLYIIEGNDEVFGVNVAHSGTVIGLLVDPDWSGYGLINMITGKIPELVFLKRVSLISGGVNIIKGERGNYGKHPYSRWKYSRNQE